MGLGSWRHRQDPLRVRPLVEKDQPMTANAIAEYDARINELLKERDDLLVSLQAIRKIGRAHV